MRLTTMWHGSRKTICWRADWLAGWLAFLSCRWNRLRPTSCLWICSARHGTSLPNSLHNSVSKECSQYTGAAGSFCTITASNLGAIKVGAKVVYTSAMNADGTLDSDLVVRNGHGNRLFGHVWLNSTTMTIRFDGGTGVFRHFTGRVAVSVTDGGTPEELWHWDGWYRFGPCRQGPSPA